MRQWWKKMIGTFSNSPPPQSNVAQHNPTASILQGGSGSGMVVAETAAACPEYFFHHCRLIYPLSVK